jgi:hypothetical protein
MSLIFRPPNSVIDFTGLGSLQKLLESSELGQVRGPSVLNEIVSSLPYVINLIIEYANEC